MDNYKVHRFKFQYNFFLTLSYFHYENSLLAREVTIDDVKRAYEVFLDDARFSNNLHEYEQYFMFNDLSNDQQQTQSKMET
ncbi:unnamed protein product [Rotaria magnacalcarata]|uniref:Uncharacterized protein n=1 Tax=Rotaria magnacalcarata TaxID=392030 RepID=A0A819T373_9BILA|nr:unnamed protein product [Rotaria magnacalcarata]